MTRDVASTKATSISAWFSSTSTSTSTSTWN